MLYTTLENINLSNMVHYTLESHEEVSIATSQGAVVMLAQDEYESMQETLRLLNDKKSLSALLESHRDRDKDIKSTSYTLLEAFDDLQN